MQKHYITYFQILPLKYAMLFFWEDIKPYLNILPDHNTNDHQIVETQPLQRIWLVYQA